MKIYTLVEAVPSRMQAIARLLFGSGALPRERFLALLQPRESGTGMAESTLAAGIECGLVRRDGDILMLGEAELAEAKSDHEFNLLLPKVLARLVLAREVNGRPNRFATICAWLLQLPVDHPHRDCGALKEAIKDSGYTLEELDAEIDARWANILYWARYLGLVRQLKDSPCVEVVPDPTLFLIRHLTDLFPEEQERTAEAFRDSLGTICPVLDGGAARADMIARTAPNWPAKRLSDALCFAVERLQAAGKLRTRSPRDQRNFLISSNEEPIAYLAR
jgi:hypothetical protein